MGFSCQSCCSSKSFSHFWNNGALVTAAQWSLVVSDLSTVHCSWIVWALVGKSKALYRSIVSRLHCMLGMSFLWESHGKRPMGWNRHKLLWGGTDKYDPWTTLGLSMGMSFLWESQGKRPMGWDRHKLLWDGNGTDKYVPWTTLGILTALVTTTWHL